MRNFLLCVVVLSLDVAFAMSGSGTLHIPGFTYIAIGVPVSTWVGISGILLLIILTFSISLFAFRIPQVRR